MSSPILLCALHPLCMVVPEQVCTRHAQLDTEAPLYEPPGLALGSRLPLSCSALQTLATLATHPPSSVLLNSGIPVPWPENFSQAVSWGSCSTGHICFLLKGDSLSWPGVQCLESHCFIYSEDFLKIFHP